MGAIKLPLGADLVGSQLINSVAENLGSTPGSPATGRFWFDTATGKFMYKDASGARDVTYLAQVLALRLDQFAAPTASVPFNSQKITGLADGTAAQDAVTYTQLLAVLQGRSFKDAVRAATTANITLSGAQTIDGISVIAGDRVLVKNQTTASGNGIYVAASGAWTRATDMDTSAEAIAGLSVNVAEGTTQGDTQWTMTTNAPITLGTTSLAFAQTGQGTTYVQGTGISITGGTIAIDTTVTVRKYAVDIGNGSLTSFTITHNLGTIDVQVTVRMNSTGEQVLIDNIAATINTVTIGAFATAPTTNQYRVIVQA